ncbi:MAG: hypothetical protein Q9181_006722 [Wetmoreana brouardii]
MPGNFEKVDYEWLMDRPDSNNYAKKLMRAAYNTAIQVDPKVSKICMRSDVHVDTVVGGIKQKDPPHITVSSKTPEQEQAGTHVTAHGYTPELNSLNITRVSPNNHEKLDSKMNPNTNSPYWPANLPKEPKKF